MSTVNVSWPASMKMAMKLLIWANNFLRSVELETAIAITVTFCSCRHKEIQKKNPKSIRQMLNVWKKSQMNRHPKETLVKKMLKGKPSVGINSAVSHKTFLKISHANLKP